MKIMVHCCVPDCTNYSSKSSDKGISYHRIPKNKDLRKAWIARVRRENLPPAENCYVCSEHFTEDCFESNLKAQFLVGEKTKRRLKRDAVPAVFSFGPRPKQSRLTSEKRAKRRLQEEVSACIILNANPRHNKSILIVVC